MFFSIPFFQKLIEVAPPLIIAVVLHEVAHGYMAYRLGDPTAKRANRINLNPLVHVDLFMTIILPLTLILAKSGIVFGGAKLVPVDPRYFKNPRKGMLWVALAGPLVNFVLAGISYLLFLCLWLTFGYIPAPVFELFFTWITSSIFINLVLALFNLFPIPPLDGGRIMVGVLPTKLAFYYAKLERYGFGIVIVLIYYSVPQKIIGPVLEFVQSLLYQGL